MAASGLEKERVHTVLRGPCPGLREPPPRLHSPQLMLVIPQARRQEGAAPELQQPTVQLLGHEIEPTESERGLGRPRTEGEGAAAPKEPPGLE